MSPSLKQIKQALDELVEQGYVVRAFRSNCRAVFPTFSELVEHENDCEKCKPTANKAKQRRRK